MGRPSRLSPREWDTIAWRLLSGEPLSALAREFGISKSAVSQRLADQVSACRRVALQLFEADQALRALTPDQQLAALRLAESIRVNGEAERIAARALTVRFWNR